MKKEDLKLCDVVEMRSGEHHILLKGAFYNYYLAFMNTEEGTFIGLDDYDDNLCIKSGSSNFDIMKFKRFEYSGDAFRAFGMIKNCPKRKFDWDWIRPESKTYNARLVCIKECDNFTKGKIYEVKNGILYGNGGYFTSNEFSDRNYNEPFETLEQINSRMCADFIELVEEN